VPQFDHLEGCNIFILGFDKWTIFWEILKYFYFLWSKKVINFKPVVNYTFIEYVNNLNYLSFCISSFFFKYSLTSSTMRNFWSFSYSIKLANSILEIKETLVEVNLIWITKFYSIRWQSQALITFVISLIQSWLTHLWVFKSNNYINSKLQTTSWNAIIQSSPLMIMISSFYC
jgi:hypothetical protein